MAFNVKGGITSGCSGRRLSAARAKAASQRSSLCGNGVLPEPPPPLNRSVRCFAENQEQRQVQNQISQKLKFIELEKILFSGGYSRFFFFAHFGSDFQFIGFPIKFCLINFRFCL